MHRRKNFLSTVTTPRVIGTEIVTGETAVAAEGETGGRVIEDAVKASKVKAAMAGATPATGAKVVAATGVSKVRAKGKVRVMDVTGMPDGTSHSQHPAFASP